MEAAATAAPSAQDLEDAFAELQEVLKEQTEVEDDVSQESYYLIYPLMRGGDLGLWLDTSPSSIIALQKLGWQQPKALLRGLQCA